MTAARISSLGTKLEQKARRRKGDVQKMSKKSAFSQGYLYCLQKVIWIINKCK
jgi:hypothetical protein